MTAVHHRYAAVDGRQIFFRETGPADAPAVVLLHGFPTSSYMFRNLVPALADRYHVIAPDHLGFGLSDAPSVDEGHESLPFGFVRHARRGASSIRICWTPIRASTRN